MLPYIINKNSEVGVSLVYSGISSASEPEYWNVYFATGGANPSPGSSGSSVTSYTSIADAWLNTPRRVKCTEKKEVPVFYITEGPVDIPQPCSCYYLYTGYSVNAAQDNITLSGKSMYAIPTIYINTMPADSVYGRVAYSYGFVSTYITSISKSRPTKVQALELYTITLSNGKTFYTVPANAAIMTVESGHAFVKGDVYHFDHMDYYVKIAGTNYYVKLNSNGKTYETPFVYTLSSYYEPSVMADIYTASKVHALQACCLYPYINNSIIYSRNANYLPIAEIRDSEKAIYPYLFDTSAARIRRESHRMCIIPRHNSWQSIVTTAGNEPWTNYYGIRIICDFYMGAFLGKYNRYLFGFGNANATSTSQLQHVRCYLSKNGDIWLYINDKLTYPGYAFRDNQKKICQFEIDINPTRIAQSSLRIFTDYEKNEFSYASSWNHKDSSNGVLNAKLPNLGTIALFGVAQAGKAVSTWTTAGYNHDSEGITPENSTGLLRFSIDFYDHLGNIVRTNNYYSAKTANALATRCGFINDNYNSEMEIALGHISNSYGSPSDWYLDYYSIP